jgi:hypothetical protein
MIFMLTMLRSSTVTASRRGTQGRARTGHVAEPCHALRPGAPGTQGVPCAVFSVSLVGAPGDAHSAVGVSEPAANSARSSCVSCRATSRASRSPSPTTCRSFPVGIWTTRTNVRPLSARPMLTRKSMSAVDCPLLIVTPNAALPQPQALHQHGVLRSNGCSLTSIHADGAERHADGLAWAWGTSLLSAAMPTKT